MKSSLEGAFKTSNPARDKYLARLFGLFNEEVVLCWCKCPQASYEDLGRPTLWESGERKSTLDFTLRRRSTGETFVAEMKCWTAYQNYHYLPLVNSTQLKKIKNRAFQEFLSIAKAPATFEVRVKSRSAPESVSRPFPGTITGAILIWAATTSSGRNNVMTDFKFADVLSIETMLDELNAWMPQQWIERVKQLKAWSDELFTFLC